MTGIQLTDASPAACCAPLAADTLSDEDTGNLAAVFRVLADPARVRIVNLLSNSPDPVCVCDFTEPLGLSQPTVSFHLKKLLTAGLVQREQRGTWAFYSLDRPALARVATAINPGGIR
jgi:ArsR family transcriptional regulator, arsenate/arsenite/antimonite-responsive transcriptional repressor